ncbi:MAG: VC0807 family protein [bacterium]|nr:VC0807 family protein [bacterium]
MEFKESENPLPGLLFGILLPSIVLLKLSGSEYLGAMGAFWLAISFPLLLSFYELRKSGKISWIPALGGLQVLATGAIGLLHADPLWIAVKEAILPLALGIAVWISSNGKQPILHKLFLNEEIIDVQRIKLKLDELGLKNALESAISRAHKIISFAFFLSATLNFALARYLVQSPVGSEAFNQELGKMTALSFPVIAVPSMMVMIWSYISFLRELARLLNVPMKDIIRSDES